MSCSSQIRSLDAVASATIHDPAAHGGVCGAHAGWSDFVVNVPDRHGVQTESEVPVALISKNVPGAHDVTGLHCF